MTNAASRPPLVEIRLTGLDSDGDHPEDTADLIAYATPDTDLHPAHPVSLGIVRPDDDYGQARGVLLTRDQAAQLRDALNRGLAILPG